MCIYKCIHMRIFIYTFICQHLSTIPCSHSMALLCKYTLHISVPAALYLSTGTQGRHWYLPGCPSTLTFYHPKPPSFHLTSIIPGCWYRGFKSPPAPFVFLFLCSLQDSAPNTNQQPTAVFKGVPLPSEWPFKEKPANIEI